MTRCPSRMSARWEFPSWAKEGEGVVQDSSPFIRSSAMSRGRIQDDRQKSSA